ncbi:PAS domain S-box protein [Arenimonas terrae]|uniref:histidine kinase n=1 Tax=Arenimonas terrae TaxID=2546226 RepID=A0A5C4RS90_9GAMM|nr:PAS domain S-box protein [Arenimonas terrae]TNJ33888.1 PAS domain S-box protein [Arenimonas terrae]
MVTATPDPGSPDGRLHRSAWLPAAAFGVVAAVSITGWLAMERQEARLADAVVQERGHTVEAALRAAIVARAAAMDRMSRRLAHTRDQAELSRQFALESGIYLQQYPSLLTLVWAGPDRVVRHAAANEGAEIPPVGAVLDVDPERLADGAAEPAAAGSRLLGGRNGELLVLRRAAGPGPGPTYLVAAIDYEKLFPVALADVDMDLPLRVSQGGREIVSRGVPDGVAPALERSLDNQGQQVRIEIWRDGKAAAGSWLDELLLAAGLLVGLLLALALRLWARSRERAEQAEHARRALAAQVAESEREHEAREAAERELGSVFESISDALYVLDRDWCFVLVNPRAEQLMQRERGSLTGRSVWDEFPEARGTEIETNFRDAARERRTVVFETYFPPLSSWFTVRVFPHPGGIAVYFQDITERKSGDIALLKAQATSARAQRLARLGSWEYDLRTGELNWSDEVLRIFGVGADKLARGLPALIERVHFDDRAALQDAQRRLHGGEGDIDIEYRVQRPDGEIRIVRELGTLVRDDQGRPAVAAGALQDITQQRRNESALRELTARLEQSLVMNRLVMDNSLDVICVIDGNGRFVQVSAASEQAWGYAPRELLGRPFLDLVHPDDRGETLRANAEVLAGKPTTDFRNRYIHKDGRVMTIQWSSVWSSHERLGFSVARDVTDIERQSQALQRANDSLQRAQDIARMGAWELELATGQLRWSEQVYRIFQVEPGEFAGNAEAFAARVHPDDLPALQAAQSTALRGEAELDIQHRIVLPGGAIGHVHERARLLRNDQGAPWLLSGTVQDVTERVQAREALRKEQEFLRAMLESLSDGIVACDAEGRLTLFNRATREFHGLPHQPIPADRWSEHYDLFGPDGRTPLDTSEIPLMRALQGETIRDQEMVIAPRGMPATRVLCSGEPIFDEAGRKLGAVVAMHDVTERRRQEDRLRESELRMRTTVESAFDCIVTMSAEGDILEFNPAAERTFGFRREDVLGTKLADRILPPEHRAAHAAGLRRHAAGGQARVLGRRLEMEAMRADGSRFPVELTITTLGDSSPPVYVGFLRDITDAKRVERLEAGQRAVLTGIAARRPLPESLADICRLYEAQYPGALCSVLLLDEPGEHVLHGAAPSLPDTYSLALHGLAIGEGVGSCGTAATRGERVVVADIATDPLWKDYAPLALEHGLKACWSTPVKSADGRVLATFATYYREAREPSPPELVTIDSMAAMAAMAIEQENAYRQLRLSEQRFRSLFDEHPDVVYSTDLEGRFTQLNQHFLARLERPPQQVLGHRFDELIAPEQVETVRAHFEAAARGEARTYELTVVTLGGARMDMRVTNLPMVVDGRVTGVFGIAQDISLLRKHQRELADALDAAEASSAQLRRLSQAAAAMNRDLAEAGLYQQLVDQLRDTLGAHQAVVSVETGQGTAQMINAISLSEKYARWRDYDVPIDGSGIYALVAETGKPIRMTQAELEAHPRWRGFGKHAADHPPMRGWLAVPLIGSDGASLGVLQLSDKRRGEFNEDDEQVAVQFAQMASIAIERARLIEKLRVRDRFFEMSAEVFVVFDPGARRWIQVNPVFSQITGYSAEELCGREFLEFIHRDDRPAARSRSDSLAARVGVPRNFQNRYVCRDGSVRWLDWVSVPGPDGLVYGVGRDITERRKAEAALDQTLADLNSRNRELQDFAFIASHDLQEPLRKIRAFSDRLQQRHAAALAPEARDYLDRTGQAAARMQVLIDDLLAYSRVARGKPFVRVDLGSVLAAVLEDLEARLESSGGQVEAGPLPTVEGDPTQLRQVFQNLIANALKFRAPDRAPRIRIDATPVRIGDAPGWELAFADNGIGFEPRYAERIFGPFQRLHGRQDYEGTGIGLAIVRRIIERHRGTIQAEGRQGEGATFLLRMPEQQPAEVTVPVGPMQPPGTRTESE